MYALALSLLLSCRHPDPPADPIVGNAAPAVSAAQLDGTPFTLAAHRGKPVVLVFWASWCGPCKRELPELTELVEHYGERVVFVSINAGETAPTAARAAAEWGISWPVVTDPDIQIQVDYRVDAIPTVVIVDADGVIRFRGLGVPDSPMALLDGLLS